MPKLPTEFRASITVVGGDTLSFYFMRRAGRAGLVTDEASLSSRRPQSHRDERHTCLRMHTHRNTLGYTSFLEGKLYSNPSQKEMNICCGVFDTYRRSKKKRDVVISKNGYPKIKHNKFYVGGKKNAIKIKISVNFAPHCFEFWNSQLYP